MVTYFARQPIMSNDLHLHGYELLYRRYDNEVSLTGSFDADMASSSVLETFQSIGTEKITGGKKAFVNFPEKMLLDGYATLFRPESLVVEVLESVKPTDEMMEKISELRRLGFTIALDDFVYRHELQKLLDLADIVKIDFNTQKYLENVRQILINANLKKCTLLAEKIETIEMLESAKQLGCKLFQGYFFARPVTMSERVVEPMKLNYLQLIGMVSRPAVDFLSVSKIIRRDVALSYRILRLVNSAYFSLRSEIKDIRQAVAFLGERELKKWVSFVALAGISENKPHELILMSMTRAHFCERVGVELGYTNNLESFFLTGLFSLLDALMDSDLSFILGGISMPDRARRALLGDNCPEKYALGLISALETGEWDTVTKQCRRLKLPAEKAPSIYLESVSWCNELLLR